MTTPTKEQIEKVFNNIFEGKNGPLLMRDVVYRSIIEWEKIKDVDARVEEMCKNNPGIKDFEDFNKAINSPK